MNKIMFWFICLLFHVVTAKEEWSHVDWAVEQGAYLHPHLEYRDQGMFATERIESGEILATIPMSLEYACIDCGGKMCTECTSEMLASRLRQETDPVWAPYIRSLHKNCTNALCRERDASQLTLLGIEDLNRIWPTKIDNLTSAVYSRGWYSGMRPLLELFNHDEDALPPVKEGNTYVLRSNKRLEAGDQAYDSYEAIGNFYYYTFFGFVPKQKPTCYDLIRMRAGPASDRVYCIMDSTSTVEKMIGEIVAAIQHEDLAMIKGAARWLDTNINFRSQTPT